MIRKMPLSCWSYRPVKMLHYPHVSGTTENVIAQQRVLIEEIAFIPKPFSANGLRKKVTHVLGVHDEQPKGES
jgi:hypothetical protein